MNNNNAYIANEHNATFFIDGESFTMTSGQKLFQKACRAASDDDWQTVLECVNPPKDAKPDVVEDNGRVSILEDGTCTIDGNPVEPYLARRIVAAREAGLSTNGLCRYTERLAQNPSYRARQELTKFLDVSNVGISNDGRIGLYKRVRSDYMDVRTGTMDNSVGKSPMMPRSEVDDDSSRTCSRGLHVCSEGYLEYYSGEKVMYVMVDPKDVVAIPYDYNHAKMRVSTYEVVADITEKYNEDHGILTNSNTLAGSELDYDSDYYMWGDPEDLDDDYTQEYEVRLTINGVDETYYEEADSSNRAKVLAMIRAYDDFGYQSDVFVYSVELLN